MMSGILFTVVAAERVLVGSLRAEGGREKELKRERERGYMRMMHRQRARLVVKSVHDTSPLAACFLQCCSQGQNCEAKDRTLEDKAEATTLEAKASTLLVKSGIA